MIEHVRDTAFGQIVRLVTGNRVFQYPEEKDPSILEKWINTEKSGYAAEYGTIEPGEDNDEGDSEEREDENEEEKEKEEDKGSDYTAVADRQPQLSRSSSRRRSDRASDQRTSSRDSSTSTPVNKPSGKKVNPEHGKDMWLVDWEENDPCVIKPEIELITRNDTDLSKNPLNWSSNKKYFVTFEICFLTFGVYIGSAIYTAGVESVEIQFGVGQVAATLGLTLFVAGYGLGPMLWAPMSEIPQIGRNPIYIGTLLIFVVLQVPTALSVNFGMLLAFRFLTGFFGSPVLATGGASLGDIYRPAKRAYAIAIWGIAAVCGPVMGPLVGGWAAMFKGWQWTIWELTWLSGFAFIFLFFFLPETSANNILYRRTKRLRKLTGNDKLKCQPELLAESMTTKDIVMMSLVKPFTLNFTEPIVFLLNLYIALIYGLLYIWFESFPIVFVDIYGFNLGEEGLAFIGILIGAIVVMPPFFLYLYKVQEKQFDENGEIKPEKRLPAACVGGFAIVICLFWFGWSSGRSPWIVPIIGSAWFSVGTFLLFNSVLNYLGDAYPNDAASVLAGNDFMRSSFGAGFPLFASAMYTKLGVDWASSLLGFLAILFIPIPFVLYRYGETIRVKYSKHARKDL